VLLGVDVGGTFTDAVLFDGEQVHTAKLPTTPDDQSMAVIGAVEEVLRYDTSTQGLARLLTRDVQLHGVTLPAGMKGLLLFGSANRDPRRWDHADELDITRHPAGHLAFGHGIHHCLGAALARLETRVALEEILPRLGAYEIDEAASARVHSGNVRGFTSLPVRGAP